MDFSGLLPTVVASLQALPGPWLPVVVAVLAVLLVVSVPMPGRGPRFGQRRDPWRTFKFAARRTVLERAGNRCEVAALWRWGRCRRAGEEVDHIYPWSRRGATVVSNGQAICARHNRAKADRVPSCTYIVALEFRRRRYFPEGADVRVFASMTDADRQARPRR